MGRPEADNARLDAMNVLGAGLSGANRYEDALSVQEAELSLQRRIGASEDDMLILQCNLVDTYESFGHLEKALRMERHVYSERVRLHGEEHEKTVIAASNYANGLVRLQRFEEAKALLRKTMPVARRVLGEGHHLTLTMRWICAEALYSDPGATLDDLRKAVTTLEETERTSRRVLGGAHPQTVGIGKALRAVRATLCRRETPGSA